MAAMTTIASKLTKRYNLTFNQSLNASLECPKGIIDVIVPFVVPVQRRSNGSRPGVTASTPSSSTTTPSLFLTHGELSEQIATVEKWQLYLTFLALIVCTSLIARLSKWVISNLQKEQESVDTEFDAGRDATSGIVASAIVSYWTWAATVLQSTTVTARYGISGAYWYAAGACIQIIMFSVLTVQLKIKAPGAKTYLQIIRARFDKRTHLIFCACALLTNFVVTAMLMLGGATVLTNLVNDLSVEMGTLLVTGTVFTYTFVGGLNATMYVCYFNTVVIFALVLAFLFRVFYSGDAASLGQEIGSIESVYRAIRCLKGPDGNKDNSYLTFSSLEGFIFGLINIVGNFGAVFIDQSYWQCAVAAKPFSAVGGFLIGGMAWFALPYAFGSTMGLAYKSLLVMDFNKTANWRALSDEQIDQGLVAPYVATRILGNSGSLMCVILVIMAVTSTGASQIIAVTSVLVYDVYQLYLKPYRMVLNCNTCLLCGCEKGRMAHARSKNICRCLSMTACKDCLMDNKVRNLEGKRKAVKAAFTCHSHGPYRAYSEYVQRLKDWCQVIFTIAILPLTLVLNYTGISLGWVYSFMGIVIGSSVVPVTLTIYWGSLDSRAMSLGAVCGPLLGFVVMLAVAATEPGGLYYFLRNTGSEVSMLAGNLVSITSGAVITVVISLVLGRTGKGQGDSKEIWEMTRDIDNPLRPWTELYAKDLNLESTDLLDSRPSLEMMESKYKTAKYMAMSISAVSTFVLIIVWPIAALSLGTMNLSMFTKWVHLITAVVFTAAVCIAVLPPIAEFVRIRGSLQSKIRVDDAVSAPKRIPTRVVSSLSIEKNVKNDQVDFDSIVDDSTEEIAINS